MKFCKFAVVSVLYCAAVLGAQAPTQQQPAPRQQAQPAAPQPPQQPAKPSGKVLFSRSVDENGDIQTQAEPNPQLAKAPIADDAERSAVTVTDYDLDVHLRTDKHHLAVRALLTVRNDGKTPLKQIPLQISSTLNWERIRAAGPSGMQDVPFQAAVLNSDADHTGQLHEAAIPLPELLAPGATVRIDATYSGTIEPNAQRLLAVGTPEDAARRSDWDRIDTAFTGLRGFGNVAWYPASAPPVILGDGARLFDEIGEQKRRMTGARFSLRLTVEFPHGQAPTLALVNGHRLPLTVTDSEMSGEDVPGVATAQSSTVTLRFETLSLFAVIRTEHQGDIMDLYTRPENDPNVPVWTQAGKAVTPFLEQWLSNHGDIAYPRPKLTLLDLPEAGDAPYETGAMLATGIQDADPEQLKSILVHAQAHTMGISGRPETQPAWLDEGLAYFISTLWTERQQGRDKAFEMLESGRSALALAEPASPGQSSGQPLDDAISPVYYRTKAAYVLWMLRGITSDDAMIAALSNPSSSRAFEESLEKAAKTDLKWFFADWVEADKGLPDLSIEDVFTNAEQSGNFLVAPHLANAGYAEVEVPVIVRSISGTAITQRVRIPARGKAVPRIVIQGRPVEVQLNDGSVPETTASIHVTKLNASPSPQPPQ